MLQGEKPTTAFVLSLVGGLFMLLGGAIMSMFGYFGYGGFRGYGYGMMRGYGGWGIMRPGFGPYGFGFGLFGVLGLVFGAIVIIGAIMLNSKPAEHATWGLVIVVFSVLSVFGGAMGAFGIGLVLGLIGGILAITWKPTSVESKT